MNRVIAFIIMMIILIGFSSCFSTISVKVHSFDMEKFYRSEEYKNIKRRQEVKAYQNMLFSGYFPELKSGLTGMIIPAVDDSFDPDDTAWIFAQIRRVIYETVDSLELATNHVYLITKSLVDRNDTSARCLDSLFKDCFEKAGMLNLDCKHTIAFARFSQTKSRLFALPQYLQRALQLPEIKENEEVLQAIVKSEIAKVQGRYGLSITSDPEAPFIYKAPRQYWTKYTSRFYKDEKELAKNNKKAKSNLSRVATVLGNSDVAIVMNDPGSFAIKGVRVDGDAAVKASYQVLGQAIKYLSYASGVPTILSGEGKPERVQSTFSEIGDNARDKTKADNLEQQHNQNIRSFLNAIKSNTVDLKTSNPEKRKAAIERMKKAWLSYKKSDTADPSDATGEPKTEEKSNNSE